VTALALVLAPTSPASTPKLIGTDCTPHESIMFGHFTVS